MAKSKKAGRHADKRSEQPNADKSAEKMMMKENKIEKPLEKIDKNLESGDETIELKISTDKQTKLPRSLSWNELMKRSPFCIRSIFKKKHEEEDVLTIFAKPNLYTGILAELIGTMLIAFMVFILPEVFKQVLPITQYGGLSILLPFGIFAISFGMYKFSGAQFNPILTVSAAITRYLSPIRALLYIMAQFVGATLGLSLVKFFTNNLQQMAEKITDTKNAIQPIMPQIFKLDEKTMVLLPIIVAAIALSAALIGFTYSRALKAKQAGGFALMMASSMISILVISNLIDTLIIKGALSGALKSMPEAAGSHTVITNPAIATIMQVFPKQGDKTADLAGEVWQGTWVYFLIPVVAGVAGFILAEILSLYAKEQQKDLETTTKIAKA